MAYCTCGILVPQPGVKPTPPALEAGSLNHWTTSEVWYSSYTKMWSMSPPLRSGKPCNQENPEKWHGLASEARSEKVMWLPPFCCTARVPSPGLQCEKPIPLEEDFHAEEAMCRHSVDSPAELPSGSTIVILWKSCLGHPTQASPQMSTAPAYISLHLQGRPQPGTKPFLNCWPPENHE